MSEDVDQVIGANIARWRTARGYSQAELADRLSAQGFRCTQQTVARIESGSRPVRVAESAAFRLALLMTTDDMLSRDGDSREAALALAAARREYQAALDELGKSATELHRAAEQAYEALHLHAAQADRADYVLLVEMLSQPVLEVVDERLTAAYHDANAGEILAAEAARLTYGQVQREHLEHLPERDADAAEE